MERRSPRVCEGCGWTYRPSSHDQRFCSVPCGHRHKRRPVRSAITEPRFLFGPGRAACTDVDPEVFFPPSDSAVPADAATACYRCALFDGCRKWALEQPTHLLFGVWAATNVHQRRALVRAAS